MIDPDVRDARPADAGELARLEQAARAGLVDARGGARWLATHPEVGAGWPDRIAVGDVVVAELCVEGHAPCLVGFIEVRGRDILHIEQVYVEPEARELGFGDALMAAAIERARARGARYLEGEALPGDRATKNLFERAGITARLITLSVELGT